MVEIRVTYEGGLHCLSAHGPSGATLESDAPKDNEGKGEAFSPTDLLATALATCMLTTMGIYARRKGINMDGASARVEKHMVADPLRRVGRLTVHIKMPGGIPGSEHQPLENCAATCPVMRSLSPETTVESRIEWPG